MLFLGCIIRNTMLWVYVGVSLFMEFESLAIPSHHGFPVRIGSTATPTLQTRITAVICQEKGLELGKQAEKAGPAQFLGACIFRGSPEYLLGVPYNKGYSRQSSILGPTDTGNYYFWASFFSDFIQPSLKSGGYGD